MVSSANGDNLQLGMLFAVIFPAVLILGLLVQRRMVKKV
jgi:hypothetical protein